jgi:hypothetical protein
VGPFVFMAKHESLALLQILVTVFSTLRTFKWMSDQLQIPSGAKSYRIFR